MAAPPLAEHQVAVRFGVLGPLQVVDGGGAARPVRAGKQRIVLAALLLAAGETVSAAGLAEALWDGCPPPNAPTVMRTYVMRLRRALGPAGARICGAPSGWAVELRSPGEFDLTEVDGLWRAARAARAARDWGRMSSLLVRALGLWRGEPLADVSSDALARRETGRLAELRLQLTEARVDADLRLGRHGELVAELRRLVAEHPLREHVQAQLMLACYLCGQQAAALEVYRGARGALAEELGVEPGEELREMHQKILTGDPVLAASAGKPAAALVAWRGGADGAGPGAAEGMALQVPRRPGVTGGAGGFAPSLSAFRQLAGLSVEELAERSGLSIGAVRNLERGRTRWPRLDSVRRLADALGLGSEEREAFIAAGGQLASTTDRPVAAVVEDGLWGAEGGQVAPRQRAGPVRQAVRRQGVIRGAGRQDGQARRVPGPGREDAEPGRAWLPVYQLSAAPADFTGRAAECERLTRVLTAGGAALGVPLAVVSGPPGAGKTSLALYVAHGVSSRFDDGQLWVHLAGTSAQPRDPAEVLGEFLRALGVPGPQIPPDAEGRAALYRSCLADRRVLVVADDAASVAQVRPLVPGTAGCAMVITSRSRLEGLDGAHLLPLEVLGAEDAVGLLARIVGEDRVATDRAAAGSLARACGGLPLALRITGAKLATRPSWPLSVMVSKLTGVQGRLGELESAEVSVRASIASTFETLSDRARRTFELLALLGPADFAEWVAGVLLAEPDAADVVSELAGQSLLTPAGADAAGQPRYRLHDLLREFAAERLADEPAARDAARLRLLAGWLQLAQLADARLPPEPYFPRPAQRPQPDVIPPAVAEQVTADPVAWFTAERVNLLSAVEQACQAGHLDLARHLASCQCAFQHSQDRYDDAERQWRPIADTAARADDQAAAAYASLRVGASMVRRGQAADALPILDRCIEVCDHSREPVGLAFALYWRATAAGDLEDRESARSAAARGIAIAQEARTRLPEYMNMCALGNALAFLGQDDKAVQASESALAIAADLGASYELEALLNLAITYTLTTRHESAVTVCLRAIDLSHALGDVSGEGLAHGVLGDAHQGLGSYQEAAASLHRALQIFRDHSARHFQAVCQLKLGCAYEAMGSPEAIGYLEESLRIFRQLRLPGKADRAQQALDRCKHVIPG